MNTFGHRLKYLIKLNDLQIKEFAKILNVTAAAVTHWTQGKRFPQNIEVFNKICDYFDCSLDYLFGRTNIKNEINKCYPHDLTPGQVQVLLEHLSNSDINIIELLREVKN